MVRSQPGHAGRSAARAASRPATRRKQREKEYIKVRSVVHNRPQSTGEQQVSAAGPQVHIDGPAGVQVPGEHQRKQVGRPGEHFNRVVIGDLAQLTTSNLEHTGAR